MSRPKAVNLHGLRWKIAAAAVAKRAGRRVAGAEAGRSAIEGLCRRLASTQDEPTGSYRSILADLLRQTLPDEPTEQVIYDSVAGLIHGRPVSKPMSQESVESVETTPSAGKLIAVAAAYRKPYVGDLHAAAEYYERAFHANPHDLRAVEGILTTGARTHCDWPRIWSYVESLKPKTGRLKARSNFWRAVDPLFENEPDIHWLRQARTRLIYHQRDLASLHQLLLEAIALRLQFLGYFASSAGVRDAMAQNRIKELSGIPLESGIWLKHLLGAYAYREHHQALVSAASHPRVDTADPRARIQAEKLRADAELWRGSPQQLHTHAAQRRKTLPLNGDREMESWVSGARIAVVGPVAKDELGDVIDSYDLVVRTGHRKAGDRSTMGSRTDLAYFAGRDLLKDYDEVAAAAERGDFKMAVTRPFYFEGLNDPPDWLRFARFENGLYFRGAPLGIQRVVYDLLQFAPAEIAIFQADFYAGSLAGGYHRGERQRFGPDSVLNDLVVVHDLLYEFRWTRRLYTSGVVTAQGIAADVLNSTEHEYLRRVEEGPLRGRVAMPRSQETSR